MYIKDLKITEPFLFTSILQNPIWWSFGENFISFGAAAVE